MAAKRRTGGKCRKKTSRSIVIESNGRSDPDLKRERGAPQYKLNNVCNADHRPANGAQRTMAILIYHNILWLSIQKCQNNVLRMNAAKNTIRIISVLNAYYRYITKIMRIMCVLKARRSISQRLDKHCPFQQKVPPVQSHRRNFYQYQQSDTGCPPSAVYSTAETTRRVNSWINARKCGRSSTASAMGS